MRIISILNLICIIACNTIAETRDWLDQELLKIGSAEAKFVEGELEEGSFMYANEFGSKERYVFFKEPLSVGHVKVTYLVKMGILVEVNVKTSRTISILKNVELTDSAANVLPIERFREVCAKITQKKGGGGSFCEGKIGTVFAKAMLVGDKEKRIDLYLSTSESPDLERNKVSPGRFGQGKPNTLSIEKETLSIPFNPSSAHFWLIDFQDTTTKKVELKIKFPEKIDAIKIGKGMRRIDDRQVAMEFGSVSEKFGAEFGVDPEDPIGNYSIKLVGGGKIYGAVAYSVSKENSRKR